MRVMVKFRFPTAGGNDALKAGRIDKVLPKIMEDLKPEAAYFYPDEGLRAGHFIVQMKDSSEVLEIGERLWFGLGGTVEMVPVMSAEDIQKGLPSVPGIVSRFGS
jgi:hypothetical protein